MTPSQYQALLNYPENMWGVCASERWLSLCDGLSQYRAPSRSVVMGGERKWELVSAFQKCIRRGDRLLALCLVSAIDSMPEHRAYFWRRLCVIVSEDIGPADDTLVSFIVACNGVLTPNAIGSGIYDLTCFLVEQMCDLPTRSRVYCSASIIENAALKSMPELLTEDERIVSAIIEQVKVLRLADDPWRNWQRKNDWRTEGMLRFVGLKLPMELNSESVPPLKMISELPSYCFDMHTRVGLEVLHRLVRGVEGAEEIRKLFQQNKIKSAHRALGEALFAVEGGRIQCELVHPPLCWLEQRVLAHRYALPMECWLELRALVEKALMGGIVDRVREEVLARCYPQSNCNQLHEQGTLDLGCGEVDRNATN